MRFSNNCIQLLMIYLLKHADLEQVLYLGELSERKK